MSPIIVVLLVLGLVILVGFSMVVGIYNKLVRSKNGYVNSFSQIDVQLQRRYDLIPNLVSVAKEYMKHEKETLEAVIKARNQALQSKDHLAKNPSDSSAAKKFSQSEGALNTSMAGFLALFENYPDLKANSNMERLMEELSSTENKVSYARQAYNDAIMLYNTSREEFPAVVLAGIFGFH